MFGYTEYEHTVISSQTISRGEKDVQLDVRRPATNVHVMNLLEDPSVSDWKRQELEREVQAYNAMPDYLVLVREGNPTYLEYARRFSRCGNVPNRDAAMQRLNEDLVRLVAEPSVDLKTLQWSELIQNDTGYGKDGSITMY